MKNLLLLFIILSLGACKNSEKPINTSETKFGPISESAMVVSAREESSSIGLEILKKGVHAFDAMMATEMALAVSYPSAGNFGGGGFMVYR